MNNSATSEALKLENIHTFYGKSHIIQGISLDIREQECVSYLGRNGAGKTTTLRTIMGLTPPQSGKIWFKDHDISREKPFEISRAGIGYVPEDRRIFGTLDVFENLNISRKKGVEKQKWDFNTVFDVFPILEKRKKHSGNQLSGGEQQMLAIARSLMGNPEMLLLDEPSQGLAPVIIKIVFETIHKIKRQGITILLVEQNVESTHQITDRYYILQQGLIVYGGSNQDFICNPALKEKYLGI